MSGDWHVSWRETEEWTDEQFYALTHAAAEKIRRRNEAMETAEAANAQSGGDAGGPKRMSGMEFFGQAFAASKARGVHEVVEVDERNVREAS